MSIIYHPNPDCNKKSSGRRTPPPADGRRVVGDVFGAGSPAPLIGNRGPVPAPPGGASGSSLDLDSRTPGISVGKWRKPRQKASFEQIEAEIDRCGDSFKVHHHLQDKGGCGARVLTPIRCGSHWCPDCYNLWADENREEIFKVVSGYQWPLSLGFTVPSVNDLGQQHEALVACFRELRKWDTWKANVRAGVASVGLTHSDKGWHCHLHTINDVEWIDIGELAAKWTAIVNARFGTDYKLINVEMAPRVNKNFIRALVEHDIHGTKEDLKVLFAEFDRVPGLFREAVEAFYGRHWIIWYGKDRPEKEEKEPCRCPRCGALYSWRAWEGSRVSREVAEFSARDGPLWADYYWGFG